MSIPENQPTPVTPVPPSGKYAQLSFIPTVGLTKLFIDIAANPIPGYLQGPPWYSTFETNGLASYVDDLLTLQGITGLVTLQHDIVVTYKLTDNGSDSNVATLPIGGTTVQLGVSDAGGVLYKTVGDGFDFVSLRKYSNGVHDNMILRGTSVHSAGDVLRLQLLSTNSARVHMFGIHWVVKTI